MDYKDQINKENAIKLRGFYKDLPDYAPMFFRAIEPRTSSRTRIAYAYDLTIFFRYLVTEYEKFKGRDVKSITLAELESLHVTELEAYVDYIKYYQNGDDIERINSENAIKRKICSLRAFYHYYYQSELIQKDPGELIQAPKLHEKEIIRLDPGEIADLLDHVEQGDKLTKQQKAFHDKTKVRDLAIVTLLLGTGIRVSELVGLNIQDYDTREGCIRIYRKGGKEASVYFGDEVEEAVNKYLDDREKIIPVAGHEDALFLSLQNKRLSVRSVELLVKKYASAVTRFKKITPHKLRSTYGTSLYQATGDIYLVADVLGHNDVNTTRKHYAAIDEDQKRLARNRVILRDPTDKK